MKTRNLLVAAAITGALTAAPLVASAETLSLSKGSAIERLGCNGKPGKGKDSCQGKAQQGKKKGKDKNACSGKEGCGGKDKGKQS